MVDPVTEADLHAYVDEALDLPRRIEVEDHLARSPAIAARIMADLRARDGLRAALAGPAGALPERTLALVRRLDRGLAWRRIGQRLRRVAAVAVLVAAGWLAHSQDGLSGAEGAATPSFVEDALQARQALLVRTRMVSQRTAPYDPAEIRAATGIVMPDLPADWRVRDVQVFPSRRGEGIEMAIDAGALGPVSLFAAPAPGSDAAEPAVARRGDGVTVHWKTAASAYALTGTGDEPALGRAALRIASTLR